MDSNHESLLFHTSVQWLSEVNMYEIKEELMLFFDAHGKHDLLARISTVSMTTMSSTLRNKTETGHHRIQKRHVASFPN